MRGARRLALAGLLGLVAFAPGAPGGAAATSAHARSARSPHGRSAVAFSGLGTWIDIFDGTLRWHANGVVALVAAQGVRTIYAETANSDQAVAIVNRAGYARMVIAAHRAGLRVVSWYLPTLVDVHRDLRQLEAAAAGASPQAVPDAIAVDIEASDVTNPVLRNRRLVWLLRRLRHAVSLPIGAIVPAPPGMALHPHYWPGFPWRVIESTTDAVLPMCYFSYHFHSQRGVAAYTRACAQGVIVAGVAPPPVHLIGGVTPPATASQTRVFAASARQAGVAGISLYSLVGTGAAHWQALRRAGY